MLLSDSFLYCNIKEISKTAQAVSPTEQTTELTPEQSIDTELNKLLANLTQERDTYKQKLEEFQTQLEEAKVG